MNAIRNTVNYSLIAALCASAPSFATIAKFSLVPTTPSTLEVPANRTAIVQYTVTNQTKLTRTLTVVPMAGISQQTDTAGVCSNPFTLASQASCLLNLVVDGSQLSAVNLGPKICATINGTNRPNSLLCSQPSNAYALSVSLTSEVPSSYENVYVSNFSANNISLCFANSQNGLLESCNIAAMNGTLSAPEGIATNPAQTFLYAANVTSSTVSFCQINNINGLLSNCQVTGSGFSGPDGIVINPAGTFAYVSNATSNSVSFCKVNASTGALFDCASTGSLFSVPFGIGINSSGSYVFVVNEATNTVTTCAADPTNGTLGSCVVSAAVFNGPEGVTINSSGLNAYVTNRVDGTISLCDVAVGNGRLENCTTTGGTFSGPGNLALNSAGTLAYMPSSNTSVMLCTVDQITGSLSSCIDSDGTGFQIPSGIVVR